MKKLKLVALLVAATIPTISKVGTALGVAGTKVDIKALIGVSTCTGGKATCNVTQTLNAVGDPFTTNPMEKEVTNLGTITEQKAIELALPNQVDEATLFSFVPESGPLAGKTVYIALRMSEKGRPGTRLAGLYPVELFRLVEGQNPRTDWGRAAMFKVEGSEGSGTDDVSGISFTFEANGDAAITSPQGEQLLVHLGAEKLGDETN